jgi:hypothetical protein
MVARRKSDDPPGPLLRRELQEAVRRTPQLERASGLQTFALEPVPGAVDFALDQRGSLDEAGDPLSGSNNIVTGDIRRFS